MGVITFLIGVKQDFVSSIPSSDQSRARTTLGLSVGYKWNHPPLGRNEASLLSEHFTLKYK